MKFLADENFDNRILRGLLQRKPGLDILHVQDTQQSGAEDILSPLQHRNDCPHPPQRIGHSRVPAGGAF